MRVCRTCGRQKNSDLFTQDVTRCDPCYERAEDMKAARRAPKHINPAEFELAARWAMKAL